MLYRVKIKLQAMLKFTDTCKTITMPPVIRLEEALKRKIAMAVPLNALSQYKVAEKQNRLQFADRCKDRQRGRQTDLKNIFQSFDHWSYKI